MFPHATINDEGICIGYGYLAAIETSPNLVYLPDGWDEDLLWRKWENGAWSVEKFEPVAPDPGPSIEDEVASLKSRQDLIQAALDDLILGGAV